MMRQTKREVKLDIKRKRLSQRERRLEDLVEMCLNASVLLSGRDRSKVNEFEYEENEKWLR